MITEINYMQNGIEQKLNIELDEIGLILIGMNTKYLDYISDKKKDALASAQNEIIQLCIDTETPIILYHNPVYGKAPSALLRKLSSYHMFELVKDSQGVDSKDSKLSEGLKKWEVKYPIITGINISSIENIAQDINTAISEIITSEKLIATPENNKRASKNQIEWLEKNEIYFHNHEDLLAMIYKK